MATRGASAREHLERLLRVGTSLAESGYGAQAGQLAACARAFRAGAQQWCTRALQGPQEARHSTGSGGLLQVLVLGYPGLAAH